MNHKIKFCGTSLIDEDAFILSGGNERIPSSALAQIAAGEHWIIFWEDPLSMIFRQLKDQKRFSSEELLERWMESASEILKGLRRHRNQVSLIHLAEAQEYPEALASFCKERFGLDVSVTPSRLLQWAQLSPVFEKISRQSVKDLQILLEELEASSVPLDSSFETTTSSRSLPPSTLFAAIDALRKMEQDGVPKEQLLATERQVVAAHRELAEQSKLIDQRNLEHRSAEETSLEKCEMLLTELHEAFKESEGYFEQWKKAESERDEGLQSANGELEQLRSQLEGKNNETAEQQTPLQQKGEALKQSEAKALQNYEMLLTELHEAFKESEGYFEQWKKAESTGRSQALKVQSISRGNVIDHGSHRHLEYHFQGIEILGRSWPSLRVRLVRHNGRSGILFFDSEKTFYAWEPSGEEAGSQFMLIVPADETSRNYLVRSTTSDLLMIKDSVTTILADLKMNGLPEGGITDWITVAESLLTQVEEIAERLHYDSVQSTVDESALDFQIHNASFRGQLHHSLKISWDTKSGAVTLYPDENARPVLSAWPMDSEGRNTKRCELFGPAPSVDHPHSVSVSLTNKDRAFLGVLLGEISNFLVHAANQHPKEASRLSTLGGRAKGLRKKALKLKSI